MQDPNNMSAQTRGKLNWENMIRDYMNNKPYTEFDFSGDRPLTLYRSQVYAILKAFGNMKPQNKVNIILNTFGDKMATVEYLDKLRAKGLMPKKVPAYVAPGTEPVPPGQMDLPGMATPKIREADDQKKNPKTTELVGAVNPRVARAMQLARARQSAAGTDTEAMVADFVDQQEKDQAEFNKVKSVNQRQDDLLKQVTAVNQQQDQEINSLDSDNADLQASLQQLQAVNDDLAKKLANVSQRRADRQQPQQAQTPNQSTATSTQSTAEPPLQPATTSTPTPTSTTAQPAPAKQKKATTRKKSSATKGQQPQQDIPNNVFQFPQNGKRGPASDEVAAALQGVDMGDELATGTYGLKENTETLNVGDPVIISGNVEFKGKTGDVVGFGRDQHFVIVDLYNFGKHAFHASNVKYNDYADQEVDEGRMKDLDISGQNIPALRTGNFVVVQKKQDQVIPLRQHTDSLSAQRHAQAIKNKYPGMQIGIQSPEGTVKYVSIKEMQTKLDRYNVNQPPPGGTNRQREKFLDARDRLFRQMQSATPGEKEAIRLKIAELEGQAQSQGIKIRETDELSRSGYNAIKSLSDWAEKMRVMRELQKDIALMSDPEAKAAVQQRIGDLLKVGIKQGYVKEALNDKAMSVLRSLKQPAQPAPVAIDLNVPEPVSEPAMDLATVRKRIAQLDELIKMKEQIDRLFVRAQNARGGIYPGLQSDIEDEELYGVPQTDQEYQTLKHKYTKDLSALQKFIAMKKAVYREGQEVLGQSSALVKLKQARQALSQQGMAEGAQWDTGDDVRYEEDDITGTYYYKGWKFIETADDAYSGEAWLVEPDGDETWYGYEVDENHGIRKYYDKQGRHAFNLSAHDEGQSAEKWLKAQASDWGTTSVSQPKPFTMNEQGVAEGQVSDEVDHRGDVDTKANIEVLGVDLNDDTFKITYNGKPYTVKIQTFSQEGLGRWQIADYDVDIINAKGKNIIDLIDWDNDRQVKMVNTIIAYLDTQQAGDLQLMAWRQAGMANSTAEDLYQEIQDFYKNDQQQIDQATAWLAQNIEDADQRQVFADFVKNPVSMPAKTKYVPKEYLMYVAFSYSREGNTEMTPGMNLPTIKLTDPDDEEELYRKVDELFKKVQFKFDAFENKIIELADSYGLGSDPDLESGFGQRSMFWDHKTMTTSSSESNKNRQQILAQGILKFQAEVEKYVASFNNTLIKIGLPGIGEYSTWSGVLGDQLTDQQVRYFDTPEGFANLASGKVDLAKMLDDNVEKLGLQEQGVAEGSKPGEYYIHTVYFKDGTKKRIRVTSDEVDVADYYNKRGQAVDRVDYDVQLHSDMSEQTLDEKQDACYNKVKSRYKVWPSAYASGALVQCRKKGAANWGNKSKK